MPMSTTIAFVLLLSSIFTGVLPHKSEDIINGPLITSKIKNNRTILVGPSEEFKTVQAAIDAVPKDNSDWIIVHVRAGIYR
ncbi:hypothetical protein BHE74_00041027 [Ensete ventricosum]|nr:hypothetical protein B296_00041168 [Ensete ventricosum]RWW06848.1 hypothetical protein GW17_00029791 [Ensete ventricosum]RWW52544.1 hypothetical protein BHE74_00041027 [Ensete ventricosum]RZS21551.1 hypothetical protein BHM03_00054205 [Ensete ventricosum]